MFSSFICAFQIFRVNYNIFTKCSVFDFLLIYNHQFITRFYKFKNLFYIIFCPNKDSPRYCFVIKKLSYFLKLSIFINYQDQYFIVIFVSIIYGCDSEWREIVTFNNSKVSTIIYTSNENTYYYFI